MDRRNIVVVSGPLEPPSPAGIPPAVDPLTDLSASLEALRADFNAHSGEARFLTLLSPS